MPKETLTTDQAQEGSDLPEEPTHSETRPRRAGEAIVERAHRTSVRPSAFGLPRASYSSLPPPSAEPRGGSLEGGNRGAPRTAAAASPRSTAHSASGSRSGQRPEPPVDQREDEGETRPSRRLQNERSRVVDQLTADASTPQPPQVPQPAPAAIAHEGQPTRVASQPAPTRARRPWPSIALFSAMLALSVVPLLRYALSRELPHAAPSARQLSEAPVSSSLAPRTVREAAAAGSDAPRVLALDAGREEQLIALIAAGNRSLEEGAVSEAERLFGRVVELDEDNPRAAYGLARVRLTQGNLSGAEGWIQLALRKRPRRRAYHALYAEVLMRLGRTDEAREEERHATLSETPSESDERVQAPRTNSP